MSRARAIQAAERAQIQQPQTERHATTATRARRVIRARAGLAQEAIRSSVRPATLAIPSELATRRRAPARIRRLTTERLVRERISATRRTRAPGERAPGRTPSPASQADNARWRGLAIPRLELARA